MNHLALLLLSLLLSRFALAHTGPSAPGAATPQQGASATPQAEPTCWLQQQSVPAIAGGVTRSRSWHHTYTLGEIDKLQIANKYGRVEVETWERPEADVTVTLTAEADTDPRAADLLETVRIEELRMGQCLTVRTVTQPLPAGTWLSADRAFRIHYRVRVPAGLALHVTNAFGDVALTGTRTGRAAVSVSYGNVRCDRLEADSNSVKVAFGCGTSTVAYARQCALDVQYSKLHLAAARDLTLQSAYADVEVEQVDNLTIHSRHGDLALGTVRNLRGTSGFARVVVDRLDQNLDLDVRYCAQVAVRSTARSFHRINLEGGYSTISLNFEPESQFSFDVHTPNGQFLVDRGHTAFNRTETALGEHRGLYGSPASAAVPIANVSVRSAYGTVRINK